MLGIAGELINNAHNDYFAYINTNIGGLKTNQLIDEDIAHTIYPDKDGNVIHKLNLKRSHNGKDEGFSGTNFAYLRFYLPIGSKVLEIKNFEKKESIKKDSATGMLYLEDKDEEYLGKAEVGDIDIYQEKDKTVLGVWQVIKPGQKIESEIIYQLPNNIKLTNGYTLLIQKQAGVLSQKYSLSFSNKDGNLSSNLENDCQNETDGYQCGFELKEDKTIVLY